MFQNACLKTGFNVRCRFFMRGLWLYGSGFKYPIVNTVFAANWSRKNSVDLIFSS
jgi:hypothetical protein